MANEPLDLSAILMELHQQLESLSPKSKTLATTFQRNRAGFQEVLKLSSRSLQLGNTSRPPAENQVTHSDLHALETRILKAIENTQPLVTKPSFASVAAKAAGPNRNHQSPPLQNTQPRPPRLPSLTLQQVNRAAHVEINTQPPELVERINNALHIASPEVFVNTRALSINRQVGEIRLQFSNKSEADIAQSTSKQWVALINPSL